MIRDIPWLGKFRYETDGTSLDPAARRLDGFA
jgi:hypothetical protein